VVGKGDGGWHVLLEALHSSATILMGWNWVSYFILHTSFNFVSVTFASFSFIHSSVIPSYLVCFFAWHSVLGISCYFARW